ncbi:cohesin subunit SA-1 [Paramisgurnus dabryanus]|uniref:cohesin subunit SA-1 n=1 Tax=Paramisgurnus dabryanus TaxID=90735 RepID=UPI0031F445FF
MMDHTDVLEPDSTEDDISLTGSDFEFEMKSSKRKLTSQGPTSPKKVYQSVRSSSQRQSAGNTPPDRERNTLRDGHASTGHLYEAVRSGRSALQTVIDDWLDEYRRDKEAGLLELMNFVVQCSGCKGVITREMFNTMQNADIIGHLTKDFNEDTVSYPLVSTGTDGQRFRTGLCEFVSLLVRACRNSLLYDDYLFASLIALLTGLSDSQVRAFRHTSTMIAMQLMSKMVAVAAEVNAQALMTKRHYDVEKSKRAEHRAIGRVEELQNSLKEVSEHQEDLRSLMNGIFKGVFVHRYRDVFPEIRAICMEEMGVWLRECPAHFLSDEHLKYVGWMLHDKQAVVRLKCVLTLQKLYEEKNFIGQLELFTTRFKERILCMTLDKDSEVAMEIVKLLLLIQQNTDDGLSDEECARVYPLVFALHRGLASAAGHFLYYMLCKVFDGESDKQTPSFLILLARFFIDSKYHEHAAYLVDSLWDVAGAELKDWEVMTFLLLQEKGVEDEVESALIDIMICAMRQAAEATPPISRSQKKNLTVKEKKLQAQEKGRITNHFIPVLPRLMAKFSADVGKVSCLLRAPLYFDLDSYGTSARLEKCLDVLLSQVCDIVQKHNEECVLEACVRVLSTLSSHCYTFCGRAERAISQLLDSTVEKFTVTLREILQGSADEDDIYSAASSLNVLAVFSSASDVTGRNLFEFSFQLLTFGVESGEIDKKLMVPALKCAVFDLLWKGRNVTQLHKASKLEMTRLMKCIDSFCIVCQSCLSMAESHIRNQAFVCLCDVLIVFGRLSEGGSSQLNCYSPDETLVAEMVSFLMDYVFNDDPEDDLNDEMKISALMQKRNQLAGYCKLVIYGVLELRALTDVLRYYNKYYSEFGDVIKETLSKSKTISSVESAKTVCLCLQQLFSSLDQDRHDEELTEIRFLAKKLAMNFSINLRLIRKPLLALHQDGIRFASHGLEQDNPINLSFLEILSEFSFKLLQPERKQLLVYLQRVCARVAESEFVKMYERSLKGSRGTPAQTTSTAKPSSKRRRTQSLSSNLESPAVTSHTPSNDTDDEFTQRSVQRKSVTHSRLQSSPSAQSVQSHFSTLSLIDEALSLDEPLIEDYDDDDDHDDDEDSEISIILPSTRGSASYLEDLFE